VLNGQAMIIDKGMEHAEEDLWGLNKQLQD
jgi:hypothetical protein